jgi:hypothetical protein
MKKSTTLLALLFLGAVANAQTTVDQHRYEEGDDIEPATQKTEISEWYNYVDAGRQYGISWVRINNATLFPDTSVYQRYVDELGRVGTHSVGQVLDPQDPIFSLTNTQLDQHDSYRIDSVEFRFRYSHNIPGTVDTLRFQIFNEDAVDRYTLSGSQRPTATIDYFPAKNQGVGATMTFDFLLDESDTTDFENTADYNGYRIALPEQLQVPAGGLMAMTMTYIPGYDYENGDTIQQDWDNPPVVKKLNHLIAPQWRDRDKSVSFGLNTGIRATSASRYRTDVWEGRYIPGHAWNDYTEHLYFGFKLTSEVGINEITRVNAIYPNPISTGEELVIRTEYQNSQIIILDMQGKEVLVRTKASRIPLDLPTGIYTVEFRTSGGVARQKLMVN